MCRYGGRNLHSNIKSNDIIVKTTFFFHCSREFGSGNVHTGYSCRSSVNSLVCKNFHKPRVKMVCPSSSCSQRKQGRANGLLPGAPTYKGARRRRKYGVSKLRFHTRKNSSQCFSSLRRRLQKLSPALS